MGWIIKWIKHDTDANQDAKLQNVLLDYGLEGYGLYWYCIELIAGKVDQDNITFELEHDARIIARNTGSTPQKVEEMMRYFVKLGLFEDSSGVITCLKLARRLDKSMTSNPQMRDLIGKIKSHDGVMIKSDKVMQDKIRSDKTREDKRSVRFAPPTQQEVLEHMQSKGHNNPSTAEDFVLFYESKNWMVGKTKMSNWKSAATRWVKNNYGQSQQQAKPTSTGFEHETPTERTRRAFAERERQQQSGQDGMVVVDGWGDIPY